MRSQATAMVAVAALLATLIVVTRADARAAFEQHRLTVQITAIHVVDWSQQDADYPDPCGGWSKGSGTQTTGVRTVGSAPYASFAVNTDPDPLLVPYGAAHFAAVVKRVGTWKTAPDVNQPPCTPCGPTSEFGPCSAPAATARTTYDCRRRTVPATAALSATDSALTVQMTAAPVFTNCPPDIAGQAAVRLHSPSPREVALPAGSARRVGRLRRGRSLTIKASREVGFVQRPGATEGSETHACSKVGGPGYSECALTDVTVEITRVK